MYGVNQPGSLLAMCNEALSNTCLTGHVGNSTQEVQPNTRESLACLENLKP